MSSAATDGHTAVGSLRSLVAAYTPREVDSVTVVGNAPLAPDADRARSIDSSDLVVRVNGFALDDEVPTVGGRCDVVVFTRGVQATPWFLRDYRDRLYLLVEPGRIHWEPEAIPDWWPPDLGWVPVPNREIVFPLSRRLGIDTVRESSWATTGTIAIWLARTLFPTAALHLAGFSFIDHPDQVAWEHATGDPCAISPEHRLDRESALVSALVADDAAPVTVHA